MADAETAVDQPEKLGLSQLAWSALCCCNAVDELDAACVFDKLSGHLLHEFKRAAGKYRGSITSPGFLNTATARLVKPVITVSTNADGAGLIAVSHTEKAVFYAFPSKLLQLLQYTGCDQNQQQGRANEVSEDSLDSHPLVLSHPETDQVL